MQTYYAGWDGGGTGTTVVCLTENGQPLLREKAGPLNPNGNPEARVLETVQTALAFMAGLPGGLAACGGLCVATAGISNPKVAGLLRQLLAQGGYSGPCLLAGDHESALYGALEGRPGAILISGTGSICHGQNANGESWRSGGRGQLIDDEGSGYAIGRDVLAAVVRAQDGRLAPTVLTQMVFGKLGISAIEELVAQIYRPGQGKEAIAAFAPLCTDACEQQDEAALAIRSKAVGELFLLAQAVGEKLGLPRIPIALAGSILNKDPGVRQGLLALLEESSLPFAPCAPAADAAHGAALIARDKAQDSFTI